MFKKIGMAVIALFVFSSYAQAMVISDSLDFDELTGYVGHEGVLMFTHTVSDHGVGPDGTLFADSGVLFITVKDDDDSDDPGATEEVQFNFSGLSKPSNFALSYATDDLAFGALAEVNTTGDLIVTVKSIFGDFQVAESLLTLQASAKNGIASVPEPGVLMLLGLGLVGLRVARPRKA